MESECRIGIDPSINSTGICVYISDGVNEQNIYYNIVGKCTRKMKEFKHDNVYIIDYGKFSEKYDSYILKERQKTVNIYNICSHIRTILKKYNPSCVLMEGVSYGSVNGAALVDLSGLNFAIRMVINDLNIPMNIVSPRAVKKFAIANGAADKDVIIKAWKLLDRGISDIVDIKIDDLADSYFIARYAE